MLAAARREISCEPLIANKVDMEERANMDIMGVEEMANNLMEEVYSTENSSSDGGLVTEKTSFMMVQELAPVVVTSLSGRTFGRPWPCWLSGLWSS